MAPVFLAEQESLGREVALKVLNPTLASDAAFVERFLREARIVASFKHRALVPVFDAGRSDNLLFLAMECLPGGNAGDLRGGDADEIRRCLIDVAGGLAYVHARGVVHRDLKPEIILRRDDGSNVLSDFGIARSVEHSRELTRPQSTIGTPSYMSPEQWRSDPIGDAEAASARLQKIVDSDWKPQKYLNVTPEFDALRPLPEFQELVRRTGLGPEIPSAPPH